MRSSLPSRIAVSYFNRRRHRFHSHHRSLGITPRPIIPQPVSMPSPKSRNDRRKKDREEWLAILGLAVGIAGGRLMNDESEEAIELNGAPIEGNFWSFYSSLNLC
jgi:hypothetical protein